jgi:ribonucleoside-diphosphate reductase beta chain
VTEILREAVDCELSFAEDTLSLGVSGLSLASMREYLQYIADRTLEALRLEPIFGSRNSFDFMELQEVQEPTKLL